MIHQWPAPLRKFVESDGAARVYEMGLDTLGYPPTWAQCGKEFLPLIAAMKGKADKSGCTPEKDEA